MENSILEDLLAASGYIADGPGVAVAVRSTDGLVHKAASGRAQPHTAFTPSTVSYLGSVAKQMVGVCAAMLVANGRLDVEWTVRQWLPEMPRWADTVRIRHLIHHTSGLPGDPELRQRIAADGEPRWDSPAVLRALTTCPNLQFRPGSRYQYCNAGYISLVAVIERIANTSFIDLAQHELFELLRMPHTRFCNTADTLPADAAAGNPTAEHRDRWPLPLSLGDGGAWSTTDDIQRWNDALLPDGALDDRVNALIGSPGRLDDGQPIDYAWGVRVSRPNGTLMHSHGGSWPGGWTAKTIRLPERGVTITALSNDGDVPRMIELTDRILHQHNAIPTRP